MVYHWRIGGYGDFAFSFGVWLMSTFITAWGWSLFVAFATVWVIVLMFG
jgi:hypothetical protein